MAGELSPEVIAAIQEAIAAGMASAAPLAAPPTITPLTVQATPKLGLKMPQYVDAADILILNDNMVTLDNSITADVAATLTNKTLDAPVINNPTITGWTNAQHTHLDAPSGGALNGAAITTGTVGTGNLVRESAIGGSGVNLINPDITDPIIRDSISFAPKPGAADTQLRRDLAGLLRLYGTTHPFFGVRATGSVSSALFGQAVPAVAGVVRLDLTANVYYTGTDWVLEDATAPGTVMSMMPAAGAGTTMFGLWDLPTGGGAVLTERLRLLRNGNLHIGPAAGVVGLSIDKPDAAGYAIDIIRGDVMMHASGKLHLANAGTTSSAGWAYNDAVNALGHIANGGQSGLYLGSTGDLYANGTVHSNRNAEGIAGMWLQSANANYCFIGGEGDDSSVRIYAPAIGNGWSLRLTDAYMTVGGGLNVAGRIDTSTGFYSAGGACILQGPNNIQLSPGGGYVHPDGHLTRNMGHPGLNWSVVYAAQVISAGQLNLTSGTNTPVVISAPGGNFIYIRPTAHVMFDATGGSGIVAPEVDNKLICGGTGNRWQYVAAVNGSINTCWVHEKEVLGLLDPEEALDALLKTPFALFHPKNYLGEVDETMTFAGPVSTTVDPRLQIGKGALTAAGHQAVYAGAAVQALHAQLATLRAEVAALREALAA